MKALNLRSKHLNFMFIRKEYDHDCFHFIEQA